jgi:single-strand DNA-binding protein
VIVEKTPNFIHPKNIKNMASFNKVILVGNLGKDPEVKNFENGGSIASFPLATTESYWDKEKNQRVDRPTDWHNIRVTIPGLVKVAQNYLHKGSPVMIEGVLRYRSYQTKEGEARYATEIHVESLQLLGAKPGGSNTGTEAPPMVQSAPASEIVGDDNLPF